jgi:hypothetical protein
MDMGEMDAMETGTHLNMPDQQQLKQSSPTTKSNNNRHEKGEGTSNMVDGKQLQRFIYNTFKRKSIIYGCFIVMSATFV